MSQKKSFLLRIDPKVHAGLERWAADEFRSVNAQIEFLLRSALIKAGRLPPSDEKENSEDAHSRSKPHQ